MTELADELAALFSTSTLRAPEDAIGFLLWRLSHWHQREMDRAVVDLDLTHLQFVTLVTTAWLSRENSPVAQPDLAEFSRIHPMQISNILKTLETKGFVARARGTADSRTKDVAITPTGIAVLTKVIPRAKAIQDRIAGLPGAGDLHAILRRIVAQLGDD